MVTKSKFIMALDTTIKNIRVQGSTFNSDLKLPQEDKIAYLGKKSKTNIIEKNE